MRLPVPLLALLSAALLTAQSSTRTVYVSLGLNADAVEDWDGSLGVTGGDLVAVEERHFMPGDVLNGSSWEASTREEQIRGFPRVNYNEMSPAELPPTHYSPVGLFVIVDGDDATSIRVRTAQGNFSFRLGELSSGGLEFLEGRARAGETPTAERLSSEEFEDDEAAVTEVSEGVAAVGWVAYKDRGDRVLVRLRRNGIWEAAQEVTPTPADIWRVSLAADGEGQLWAFWSQRDGTRWDLWGRMLAGDSWSEPQKVGAAGSSTFHRAAATGDGTVVVVWQSADGPDGQAHSDIWMRAWDGSWGEPMRVSESPANDWEPQVAGGPGSEAHIVWDSYDGGNYDIFYRPFSEAGLGEIEQVTTSPRFQAHANVVVAPDGTPWLAWDESGANWGKDVGYLITPPNAVPLHQERSLQVVRRSDGAWSAPKVGLEPFYVYRLYPNFENPQLAFDSSGTLTMLFRHWTRQRAHSIGARMMWETFLTRFNGNEWSLPVPLPHSQGSIEKRPEVASVGGQLLAAWMTDNRPFSDNVPRNAEVYAADLGTASEQPDYAESNFVRYDEPFAEEIPIHPFEERNVKTIRGYIIDAGERDYKIYRGDMHRHTDVSQDFKYDGSLIEVYRYALDAAAFDYIVPTDHQLGYDQEFTWWQDEKLADLFHVPGSFVPMFGYERSLRFPNGHRNIIFGKRGTRTLPIPDAEQRGEERAARLYAYLHENDGISMPHSSGTAQGTDWFDNDPDVEPLVEIFQGYRASYEYMGAPLAASPQKLREQRSGFNPIGYWWDALRKGYKIGVQASSDHWSTHMSYAMIVAEDFTRESMFAALKARHAYAATDNIVLDFQAEDGQGRRYIMGDIIDSDRPPRLTVRVIGTDRIKQFVIVKNEQIVYTSHPNQEQYSFEYTDRNFEAGSNYYYIRALQNDGQVAWSSPIWVE
ncbi:MAG: DUF3604 domain-containing protein [Bryobacterales bacterium]|nr:DUF3604 domain-containing protein [Bryobacterales bacterium]